MDDVKLPCAMALLFVAEFVYSHFIKRDANYEVREAASHVAMFAVYAVIIGAFLFYAAKPAYSYLFAITPLRVPKDRWWSLPLTVVLADLVAYWGHRAAHANRILWSLHFSHHSAERFNLTTGLRLSWLHGLANVCYGVPFGLVGFPLELVIAGTTILNYYSFFVHTTYVPRLPLLGAVLHLPSHHRVHHGKNERYVDKNFGVMLIVWDRLFGTFVEEEEPVIYGAERPLPSNNPLTIQFTMLRAVLAERAADRALARRARERALP